LFFDIDEKLEYLTEDELDNANDEMNSDDEPTEKDSEMDLDDGTDGEDTDNSSGSDMDMGDGSEDDGDSSDGSDSEDGSLDGDSSSEDPQQVEESIKKKRLYKEYKNLLYLVDDLITSLSNLDFKDMSKNESKIYLFIDKKMDESQKKMRFIMTEQFPTKSYKELLTLFMYFKVQTKSYAELIDRLILQKKVENE
jgi:hypothetical protein